MKKIFFAAALTLASAVISSAQVTLDNFDSSGHTGSVNPATSWNGNVTQNTTTITVGNTAQNDSGWVSNFAITDFSSYSFVAVTAQVDAGNVAPALKIGFTDDNGNSEAFTILTNSFTSSLTTQYVALAWTTVDPTIVVQWNIGGGLPSPGSTAFHMTFDNLALSATGAPIPEPATYAAVFGVLALGFAAYRRRQLAA